MGMEFGPQPEKEGAKVERVDDDATEKDSVDLSKETIDSDVSRADLAEAVRDEGIGETDVSDSFDAAFAEGDAKLADDGSPTDNLDALDVDKDVADD